MITHLAGPGVGMKHEYLCVRMQGGDRWMYFCQMYCMYFVICLLVCFIFYSTAYRIHIHRSTVDVLMSLKEGYKVKLRGKVELKVGYTWV